MEVRAFGLVLATAQKFSSLAEDIRQMPQDNQPLGWDSCVKFRKGAEVQTSFLTTKLILNFNWIIIAQ
jgi:hypothetical protein